MKRIVQYINRTPRVKIWHLVVLTLLFGGLSLVALRANNQRMGELKKAVVHADQQGEGVYQALEQLADYVFKHMNTSTEIELAETYGRKVQRAFSAAQTGEINTDVYQAAEQECNRPGVPGTIRAQCLAEYVTEHASSQENSQPFEPPAQQPFKYEFVAPRWSLDAAGMSVLLFAVTSVWLIAKTTVWFLRHH